jgi:hypothetical protein
MTMVGKSWLALLGGALLLASGGAARAEDDVLRLGGSIGPSADTLTLARYEADDATELVYYRGHGHGHYGHRHYGHYGHRPYGHYGHHHHHGFRFSIGFGYGGYGYRPYFGSYYRPYHYGFYHRPYYNSYRPYYSSYYPRYYYPTYYYPSYYSSYYPCADDGAATTLYLSPGVTPPPPADDPNGTYRYDGGPSSAPPPLPGETAPSIEPKRPIVPRQGLFVSLPTSPVSYPAYGQPPATPVASERGTVLVSTPAPSTAARVSYPAYGETLPRK